MKDLNVEKANADLQSNEIANSRTVLLHDDSGDTYAQSYNGHLLPSILMKLACGEPPHSDILEHLACCDDARCESRIAGFCERFKKDLPFWLSKTHEHETNAKFDFSPMRLAASANEPVVVGEWTVCKLPSMSSGLTNTTVLRVERIAVNVEEVTLMIRLDWQDKRRCLLGSTLGVLDQSLTVVEDSLRKRRQIAQIAVPHTIASTAGAVLSSINVVTCLDDIGTYAVESLTESMTQSLKLELTNWISWENAMEAVLNRSPKAAADVGARVRLALANCRSQFEHKDRSKRLNSSSKNRTKNLAGLFTLGAHHMDTLRSFAASASVVSILIHSIKY